MNRTKIKNALLASLSAFLIGCIPHEKSDNNSRMAGVWRAVFNDSVYSEMVITPNKIYSENGKEGDLVVVSKTLFHYSHDDLLESALLTYQRTSDSLLLFHDQMQVGAFAVVMLKNNEIHLAQGPISLHLTRILQEKKAMADVLNIDTLSWDNPYFDRYLKGYYDRKREFESKRSAGQEKLKN